MVDALESLREGIPALAAGERGALVYLDSAASSLKHQRVIDAVCRYYQENGANVHRSNHQLSELASEQFEAARAKVASFIGGATSEIVFTSNATVAINIVALGLEPGGNIVTTSLEHHSNLLPWMERFELRMCPVAVDGLVDPNRLLDLIDANTRLVTVTGASNVTGTITDLASIIEGAHQKGVKVLVDGAQSVPHMPTNVTKLGCDYLAFSGHKMLGPTGIGVLYGTREALEPLGAPIRGGGTPRLVRPDGFTCKPLPHRLEPGTPHVAGVLGLHAAVDVLDKVGMAAVDEHGHALAAHLMERLAGIDGVQVLGPPPGTPRLGLATLRMESELVEPNRIAQSLSERWGICVRSGHHCCHPFFDGVQIEGGLRVSTYAYSTRDEIDIFAEALAEIIRPLV